MRSLEISIPREREVLRVAFRGAMAFALMACSTKSSQTDAPVVDGGLSAEASVGSDAAADAGVRSRCDPEIFAPDPPDTCGDYVHLACGLPSGVVPRDNCYLTLNDCAALCPDIQFNCRVIDSYCLDGGTPVPDEAGAIVIDCAICPSGSGRTPAGLVPAAVPAGASPLGRHFARAAHFEAASIHAFRTLRRELVSHDAPASLVRATRAAARDEARHTRAMARLARQHGADWARPSVDPPKTRSLEDIATENLVEGCIRETLGALVLAAEAKRICDPEVAEALGAIANDELAHAALSWAVQRWADARLDADARTRTRVAARGAIESLRTTARREASASLGLSSTERVRFVDALTTTVWSALFEA